mmetsp:Transcript_12452/g.31870  ORF Transcript_12452/g.31870 Transcript_12452/m.31870 type:complete len:233 (+) Transcript_12452:147-845(+)
MKQITPVLLNQSRCQLLTVAHSSLMMVAGAFAGTHIGSVREWRAAQCRQMASAVAAASLQTGTLCTRTMSAPPAMQPVTAAAVAQSRSAAAVLPVAVPRKPLRDGPTSSGGRGEPLRRACRRGRSRMSSKFCACVLANPMPGSAMMRQDGTPAATAASMLLFSSRATVSTTSPYVVLLSDCIVLGLPRMCIMTYGTAFIDATWACMRGSSPPPVTSFTKSAPSAIACAATSL